MFSVRYGFVGMLVLLQSVAIYGDQVPAGALDMAPRADISDAVIVVENPDAAATAATVLDEEAKTRFGVDWKRADVIPASGPYINLAIDRETAPGPEGFTITHAGSPPDSEAGNAALREGRITITGADPRGLLFGVGHFLRSIHSAGGHLSCPAGGVSEKPDYPIRGHQLGYRARANSWDAWTPAQFDQHIRELALFGTNAIENIPFQDDDHSPHFKVSRREMNRAMSEICAKYDLQYWVWTPADFELTDESERAENLAAHEQLYADCPRMDGVFFPGGDPGDNHPSEVMPFLAEIAQRLQKHHPEARVWISPQGFHGEKLEYMFAWIEEHQPSWLGGVVGGPGSPPLDEIRAQLGKHYQLRDYPDITHIVRCQYPVLNLDQAYALTLGRECINARPVFQSKVFAMTAPNTDGFISYSDGVHDDANKILWSQLGWDASQTPRDIMIDYCRYFFGGDVAAAAADGLFALENNWDGPIRENGAIEATLSHWRKLEAAHPELQDNWRWQMFVLRAYYDSYTRNRLFREQALEAAAMHALGPEPGRSPAAAMEEALNILNKGTEPGSEEQKVLREHIVELFDRLYHSIGLQSDMTKYGGSGPERGCSLEFLDYPLNNRWWLEDEFEKIAQLPGEDAQWSRLKQIQSWSNPGPGSFYDNLGYVGEEDNVVRPYDKLATSGGFAWWDSGYSRARLSWQVYSWPREGLEYKHLDPEANYVLRFAGFGDLKVTADGQVLSPTAYGTENGDLKEYPVPRELTEDGTLLAVPSAERLPAVNWRYQPRLAEAWLIKQ